MTLDEALSWWFAHANFEQRTPTPADLKLDRMRALLARLGDPHRRLRVVHVAGSKGKGSTSAMLAAVLQSAGYRVGLFTSPHLSSLEERFQVDGEPITKPELLQLLTEIHEVVNSGHAFRTSPPTFFEIATAAGFLHFVRRRVGAAVLEVGLGGRLDSTNVCIPALSVITSISYDHTRILGDRLAQIAREKAGIVKPGRPVVSGATVPEARAVIEQVCRDLGSPLVQLERDFTFSCTSGRVTASDYIRPRVEVVTRTRRWPVLELNLLGEHQGANAALVVACVEEFRRAGWHASDDAVTRGLAGVIWPARMEILGRRPFVILDCAHNVASAEALVETLEHSLPRCRRLLVFGGSGDKDVAGMFRVLAPAFSHAFLTRYMSSARSLPTDQLAGLWRQVSSSQAEECPSPREAIARAAQVAQPEDLVCITGSVFLAGEARPLLTGSGEATFSLAEKRLPG